jgi:small subunit ribosomal protein S6
LAIYETTVGVDSMLKPDDVKGLRDRIANFISNNGGELIKVDDWGKRRLAYEIKKKQYGFYIHMRFNAPPGVLVLLEKEYRLNESVLRYLTIKVDKRALKKEEQERQKPLQADMDADRSAPRLDQNGTAEPIATGAGAAALG